MRIPPNQLISGLTPKRQCLHQDRNETYLDIRGSNIILRQLDLSIATSIAGFAGIQTRDTRGNLSPEVWTQHSDDQKIGQLLDADALKTLLLDQLKIQLDAQKDLLQEVQGDIVIDFIIRYKEAWEKRYKENIQRNYDISQRILSAMHDVIFEVEHVLNDTQLNLDFLRTCILETSKKSSICLPDEDALIRFIFRNPFIGPVFRRAAGKLLQKKEVCNKAGGYSAKQQRDDITQERDEALLYVHQMLTNPFDNRLLKCLELTKSNKFLFYITDHKLYNEHDHLDQLDISDILENVDNSI